MDQISFTIEAEPVPASRPRVTSRGMTFYPAKHTAYANYLREFLDTAPVLRTQGPVAVRLLFVMPRYKTSDSPVHRSDVDNLSKLPLDMMTKAMDGETHRFWVDDNLVVHLTALKRFAREGEEPHTRVRVQTIEGSVEDYIDRMFDA